jgi:CRISPR-associated endonuclease Cas2
MLLAAHPSGPVPRLTVLSYDISSAKRARRVRRVLDPLRRAKQYSVYETLLHRAEFRGVLAELTEYCDLAQDKLAVWWPRRAIRIEWLRGALRPIACDAQQTNAIEALKVSERSGNFVVCYDVSEPETLDRVADCVAAQGAMLQRSVYWLRVRYRPLAAVLERCGRLLAKDDRLWAYPLQGADDLWRVGPQTSSILPVTADRWASNS